MPLLALLLLLAADAPEVVRGRLCIGESKKTLTQCSDVTGRAFGVAPADRERLFVWTSADGSASQLGVVAPKAEKIDLDAGERTTLDLSITGSESRGWPAGVNAAMTLQERSWNWTLDARSVTRLRKLVVPRGRSLLHLRAERHREYRRQIDARGELVALREIALEPQQQARGIVVDAEGKAIIGAQVMRMDATLCATADERGAFVCEMERKRGQEGLTVISSGYAAHDLPLPGDFRGDVDFGRITLTKGHKLTVKVVRPEAGEGTVTLFRDLLERYEHATIATRDIREREEEVRFEAGEGNYYVLVAGAGDGERLEVPVKVKDAGVAETITVEPYRVVGTLRFGDDVVAEGMIGLGAPEHTWRAEIPVTAGSFETTLWQRGRVSAFVHAPEVGVTFESVDPPATIGTDPTRWDIRIEKKMIVGRVFDAETKEPVRDASMQLTAESEDGKSYSNVKIGDDGSYQILSTSPGTYTVRLTLPEYVPLSLDIPVTPDDRIKTVDIALERGVVQPLQIALASGAPAGGAMILEGVQPDRVNPQHMSSVKPDGEHNLRGKPGETRLLYILPREGSFAVLRVVMPKEAGAKPLHVVVPDGTATLRVRVTRDDKPVASRLLVRYNGEFVPGAILRFVTRDFVGTKPDGEVVIPRLPAGMYEVWALAGDRDEVQMIASGGALRPPARVGLSAGEGVVQVVAPAPEVRRRGE